MRNWLALGKDNSFPAAIILAKEATREWKNPQITLSPGALPRFRLRQAYGATGSEAVVGPRLQGEVEDKKGSQYTKITKVTKTENEFEDIRRFSSAWTTSSTRRLIAVDRPFPDRERLSRWTSPGNAALADAFFPTFKCTLELDLNAED
ncbi:MAG TPA: hypothetical protein VE641_04935 [Chthoniobacterales bacterium]|nr:hypothetical protein [Chthoniobacterales bacterium]